MPLQLDHVVIAVADLERAMANYTQLGFTVVRGGVHANRATHNALIVFANGTYLELLAATGETPLPERIDFSAMLDAGEGFVGYALRTDAIERETERLQAAGFAPDAITEGSREKAGRLIRWKLALLNGGFRPFWIQDITPQDWRIPTDASLTRHVNGAQGLIAVEIAVRDFDRSAGRYGRLLGDDNPALVTLSEGDTGASDERLYALHLQGSDDAPSIAFPLAQTHGVRFYFV